MGRIIATQVSSTPYPINHPYNLENLGKIEVDKIKVNYPRAGVAGGSKVVKNEDESTPLNKSMVHILDLGSLPLPSDPSTALESQISPTMKGQLLYPNLFNEMKATDDLRNLASFLFSGTSNNFLKTTHMLIQNQFERTISGRAEAKRSKDDMLTPFAVSQVPLMSLVQTMTTDPDLRPNSTPKQIATYLDKEYLTKRGRLNVSIFEQGMIPPPRSDIESTDPRLALWLLPILYQWEKPGVAHPTARGPVLKYGQTHLEPQPAQAQSLHWVPLSELVHSDPYLTPRFLYQDYLLAPTVDMVMNRDQHIEKITHRYNSLRPDLVDAFKDWTDYLIDLPIPERSTLAALSGEPVQTTAVNDMGQLITTSTGQIFPARQSHLTLLQSPQMSAIFAKIIKKGRKEAFAGIPGREQSIVKKLGDYPDLGRQMGYSFKELGEFAESRRRKNATRRSMSMHNEAQNMNRAMEKRNELRLAQKQGNMDKRDDNDKKNK